MASSLRYRNHWTGKIASTGWSFRKSGNLVSVAVELTESATTPKTHVGRYVSIEITPADARWVAKSLLAFADKADEQSA